VPAARIESLVSPPAQLTNIDAGVVKAPAQRLVTNGQVPLWCPVFAGIPAPQKLNTSEPMFFHDYLETFRHKVDDVPFRVMNALFHAVCFDARIAGGILNCPIQGSDAFEPALVSK
jgi:hypothetical protein